ncbi:MAG TPA: dienelactone hydrolase family protein [Acidimicrobiales bacterium]|nr:dienelactone hydrolase family protein [Acidimicrobiales bacterium]
MRTTLSTGTPAILERPAGEPARGVVLLPDVGGLRPLFDDLCARLAGEYAWAVCAPEPFPGKEDTPMGPERLALIPTNDDDRFLADVTAAAELLGTARTAAIGFCQGGMWAYKASTLPVIDRAVAFYGMVRNAAWARPGHADAIDFLRQPGRKPVLSINGGVDQWTPDADLADLRALPDVDVVVYPDADHAFVHGVDRPVYRPDDAADAWARVARFLA